MMWILSFSHILLFLSASFFLLALLCLDLHARTGSVPICANGHSRCYALSLSDLFDRVIQHSARMHSLSSDLHSEFVSCLLSWKLGLGQFVVIVAIVLCHTSNILTPNGKENAQKLTVSITLLLVLCRGLVEESITLTNHDLLYCFRRDSNKVQNYLKILKCRIVPENGC
uniref:Uncharacterized protein n=1 Tax=Denticeps clupeoides TaxID=299321 RepID=A0AAY4EQ20_9TELE